MFAGADADGFGENDEELKIGGGQIARRTQMQRFVARVVGGHVANLHASAVGFQVALKIQAISQGRGQKNPDQQRERESLFLPAAGHSAAHFGVALG